MNLPFKIHSSSRLQFFSNVILVSNDHGCKEEAINLIPHYLIEIIHKTVKPLNLEKLQIIQNINKLIFNPIFIFSDLILIKLIIVSSTHLFLVLGGNRFSQHRTWSFEWRTGAWIKMHRLNSFYNVGTINWNFFPSMVEHASQGKLNKNSGER